MKSVYLVILLFCSIIVFSGNLLASNNWEIDETPFQNLENYNEPIQKSLTLKNEQILTFGKGDVLSFWTLDESIKSFEIMNKHSVSFVYELKNDLILVGSRESNILSIWNSKTRDLIREIPLDLEFENGLYKESLLNDNNLVLFKQNLVQIIDLKNGEKYLLSSVPSEDADGEEERLIRDEITKIIPINEQFLLLQNNYGETEIWKINLKDYTKEVLRTNANSFLNYVLIKNQLIFSDHKFVYQLNLTTFKNCELFRYGYEYSNGVVEVIRKLTLLENNKLLVTLDLYNEYDDLETNSFEIWNTNNSEMEKVSTIKNLSEGFKIKPLKKGGYLVISKENIIRVAESGELLLQKEVPQIANKKMKTLSYDRAIVYGNDSSIYLLNLNTIEIERQYEFNKERCLGLSVIDEDKVLAWSENYNLVVWSLSGQIPDLNENLIRKIQIDKDNININSDIKLYNNQFLISEKLTKNVYSIQNLMDNDKVDLLDLSSNLNGSDFVTNISDLNNGEIVFSLNSNRIIVYNFLTKKIVILSGHKSAILGIALHSKYYVTWASDSEIKLWDQRNGNIVRTLKGHKSKIVRVISSEEKLFSFDEESKLIYWNTLNGTIKKYIIDNNEGFYDVSIQKRGNLYPMIFTLSNNHIIKMYDFSKNGKEGELITTLEGHDFKIKKIELMNFNGRNYLSSMDEIGFLKIWDLNEGLYLRGIENVLTYYKLGNENASTIVSASKKSSYLTYSEVNQSHDSSYSTHQNGVDGFLKIGETHFLSWDLNGELNFWSNDSLKPISYNAGKGIKEVQILTNGQVFVRYENSQKINLFKNPIFKH